ncbi:MAG: hypothetical protein ACW981_19070 [Candidatus Hodarchaeales archaeon]
MLKNDQGYTLEDFENIVNIKREKNVYEIKSEENSIETDKMISRIKRNIEKNKLQSEYKKEFKKPDYIPSKLVDDLQIEWSFGELPLRIENKKIPRN